MYIWSLPCVGETFLIQNLWCVFLVMQGCDGSILLEQKQQQQQEEEEEEEEEEVMKERSKARALGELVVMSKLLSRYMAYLLVHKMELLPCQPDIARKLAMETQRALLHEEACRKWDVPHVAVMVEAVATAEAAAAVVVVAAAEAIRTAAPA